MRIKFIGIDYGYTFKHPLTGSEKRKVMCECDIALELLDNIFAGIDAAKDHAGVSDGNSPREGDAEGVDIPR